MHQRRGSGSMRRHVRPPGFCVAVDDTGDVLTSSNPSGGASAWSSVDVDGSNYLSGISCPSAGFCVAVDDAGDVLTSSNPSGGASAWSSVDVDGSNYLSGISCPSAGFCVAVDQAGDVLTSSNPAGGASAWSIATVDAGNVAVGGLLRDIELVRGGRRCRKCAELE